tara:strand:- start:19717 stop:21963 length:2247 start_codon:yes stop_codon:yes gene_type:complete
MTEEIIFKVGVNTGNTAKDLGNIEKELKSISNTSKDIGDIDKRFDDLNKRVESGTMTMRESTRAIKEYQTIALQAGADSPVGAQAIANAAKLTDELGDLKNAITNASHDGANMQAALQLGSGVAAGYGVMQGTMALLGDESEDLQKTFVKLQAVQAVLTGIEQIRATLEKESFLMQKAKTIATKVQTGAEIVYAAAVGGTTGAMKLARIAMLALPIVAIIAGIVALVAAFSSWNDESAKAEAAQKKLQAATDRTLEQLNEQSKLTDKLVEATGKDTEMYLLQARARGASEKELTQIKQDQSDLQRKLLEQDVANQKREYDKAANNKKINLKEFIKFEEEYFASKDKLNAFDISKRKSELEIEVQNVEAAADAKQVANNKAAANREAARKKAEEKEKADEQLRLERIKLMTDYTLASIEDEELQKLMILQESHKREEAELIAKFGKDTELIKQLGIKQAQEVTALNNELALAAEEAKKAENAKAIEEKKKAFDLEMLNKRSQIEGEMISMKEDSLAKDALQQELWLLERDAALANTELTAGEEFKIEEEYQQKLLDLKIENAEKEKQIQTDNINTGIDIAAQGMNAIQGLSDAIFAHKNKNLEKGSAAELANAKKQFKINKAMQLGGAVIDAAKGIMASLASSPVAIGPIPNPAGIASLAFVGISAAANIAKIAAAKFEGGGGGGSASVAAPSIPTPSVAEPTLTGTAGLQGSGTESNAPKATKIFVVDSEITAKQKDSNVASNIATVQ